MSFTEKLVAYVCGASLDSLPPRAFESASHCVLDGLGVILAGSPTPAANLVREYARTVGGNPEATVIGSGFRTSLPLAALVNGTMGHILDFDDTSSEARAHLTTVLLPAILAAGEKTKASGKEVLGAYILGFEAACRIGKAVNPGHYLKGYHGTSTIGIFGAAAAAGRLFRLSPDEMARAFGIAGSRSAGLRSNFGTMTKPLHAGMAAHDAVAAVLLAKSGFTSNPRILETELGFGEVLCPETRFDTALENLGNPPELISSGVIVKQYPSGALIHPAVDAALGLIRENRLDPSRIQAVRCGTGEDLFRILIHPSPRSGLEAKFSMPYCVARVCLDGSLGIEDFTDDRVREPRLQAFMKRVTHYAEPGVLRPGPAFRAAAKITIEMDDGQTFVRTAHKAKGSPEDPLSFAELAQKFRACVKGLLPQDRAGEMIQWVQKMEHLSDIRVMIELLRIDRP